MPRPPIHLLDTEYTMQVFPFNPSFAIDGRLIGAGCPVYIIAEAGVAHFGSLTKAFELVDMAVAAGADAVKFQIFQADALICGAAPEWKKRLGSRALPFSDFKEIQGYCRQQGITFLVTAHDESALEYIDTLQVPAYKIGSGEVDNWPFINQIAWRGRPVIFSTGMYTLEQVQTALSLFAEAGNHEVAVLHCVTSYPVPPAEVNLLAMDTIRDAFQVVTGYSDHTQGYHFPLAAVALGAKIIEKHITLDFDVPDAQDWKVSCGWHDLALFIKQVREIELGLGSGLITPTPSEQQSLAWARKSLVAATAIMAGEVLDRDKIVCKRPGTGIPPSELDSYLGRRAKVAIAADTLIRPEDLI
jgi:N-acetylneuraminate synthase/N,N'-diacetyllegionaminate synthase